MANQTIDKIGLFQAEGSKSIQLDSRTLRKGVLDVFYGLRTSLCLVETFSSDPELDRHSLCDALRELDAYWEGANTGNRRFQPDRNPQYVRMGIAYIANTITQHPTPNALAALHLFVGESR